MNTEYSIDITSRLHDFHDSDKVWFYKSPKKISDRIIEKVKEDLSQFLSEWNSHGKKNKASFLIIEHQFIAIIVDNSTEPSGCSIDSNVQFLKQMEEKYQLSLLENDYVYFVQNGDIHSTLFHQLSEVIDGDTLVIKPYFENVADLRANFVKKAKDSVYKNLL